LVKFTGIDTLYQPESILIGFLLCGFKSR
jgi:hypothetical protein